MDEGFVAVSEISIEEVGAATLIDAFRHRLGEVDSWPGFRRLEVWQQESDATRFVMVSWWDDQDCFRSYMQSDPHRRSHDRIPNEPVRPKPAAFRRYRIVAD